MALHLKDGHFITERNLTAIALGFSPLAFMAVGMTAALVCGGFDLSVGSVFALGGVVTAVALRDDMFGPALPIGLAILAVVLAGVLAGMANGLLITKVHINPFITTLGMMSIAPAQAAITKARRSRGCRGNSSSWAGRGYGRLESSSRLWLAIAIF